MARLSLSLLGPLQVTLDGSPVTGFESDKVRALLTYLAVEGDRSHRREALAGLLWPDEPDSVARHSLSQALFNLRQVIGDRTVEPPFLLISRDGVRLNPASDHWVDATTFTALLTACDQHKHRRREGCASCTRRMEEATEMYRDCFLDRFSLSGSEPFEEWALVKRESLHRLALQALSRLSGHSEGRGSNDQACRYAWRQLELERWREEAHRQLMRLLALGGQRSAALAQYESCRQILADELGIEPAEETVALYERIRTGQLEIDAAVEPPPRLHNLPPQPTPFIGREHELAELAGLVESAECRLVTVVGPGGIGKTRVALHAAEEQVGAFSHGVYYVPLGSIRSTQFLVSAIADALGFSFYDQEDPAIQLVHYLSEKEVLLVLDNFEHLLDGAGVLAEMLERAPGVHFLVTSRERLNLRGEWVFDLHGLHYPPSEQGGEIEGYSAVQLFLQSARRAQAGFSLTAAEVPFVVHICRFVEGMPLAVELAAAWVPVLSCEGIARELAHNLDILATSMRDVPQRHRSVRAVFDHSWNLLSERERSVFRALSVFRGGFRREAAESVTHASLVELSALVAKSLLRRSAAGRYEVHELLRQYAEEKLQAAPHECVEIQGCHSAYYSEWLYQREHALQSESQRIALAEIGQEFGNVRQAWLWAAGHANVTDIRKCLEGLWFFYEARAMFEELVDAYEMAAASLGVRYEAGEELDGTTSITLGFIFALQAACLSLLGRARESGDLYRKSLALLRHCGARRELALCLNWAGWTARVLGNYTEASECLHESLTISQEIGDRWGMAYTLNDLGNVAYLLGDYARAKLLHGEGLALSSANGDLRCPLLALHDMGDAAVALGEYAEARQLYEEGLALARDFGSQWHIGTYLHDLGNVAYLEEEREEAQRLLHKSLTLHRDTGYRMGIAACLNTLAHVALSDGEYASGKNLLRESLTICEDVGDRRGIASCLYGLGAIATALGAFREAEQYFCDALKIAMDISAVGRALDVLVGMAALLLEEGTTDPAVLQASASKRPPVPVLLQVRAAGLLALVLRHQASEKATRDRAESLHAAVAPQLPAESMRTVWQRAAFQTLDEVAQALLHGSSLAQNSSTMSAATPAAGQD